MGLFPCLILLCLRLSVCLCFSPPLSLCGLCLKETTPGDSLGSIVLPQSCTVGVMFVPSPCRLSLGFLTSQLCRCGFGPLWGLRVGGEPTFPVLTILVEPSQPPWATNSILHGESSKLKSTNPYFQTISYLFGYMDLLQKVAKELVFLHVSILISSFGIFWAFLLPGV